MRQRNARAETLTIPDLGIAVPPGGEIDPEGDELLAGFEPVPHDPPPVSVKPPSAPTTAGLTSDGQEAVK